MVPENSTSIRTDGQKDVAKPSRQWP